MSVILTGLFILYIFSVYFLGVCKEILHEVLHTFKHIIKLLERNHRLYMYN